MGELHSPLPLSHTSEILTFLEISDERRAAEWQIHMMNDSNASLRSFDSYSFGKRLQSARKNLGITQEELAERLRVDRNHVTRMERGVRACSIDLLVEMAILLNVSTDYLLMGTATAGATKQKLLIAIEELNKIAQTL